MSPHLLPHPACALPPDNLPPDALQGITFASLQFKNKISSAVTIVRTSCFRLNSGSKTDDPSFLIPSPYLIMRPHMVTKCNIIIQVYYVQLVNIIP